MVDETLAEDVVRFLNEELFHNVVIKHLNLSYNGFKIISIKNDPATNPGDNYMSALFRSRVKIELENGREQTLSYIVKVKTITDFNEQVLTACDVFPKEQRMYSSIIPEFERLYSDAGVDIEFGPKFFYATDEPTSIIIMEDCYLDMQHCEIGLGWMAKFHAASMVYKDNNGPFHVVFRSGTFTMDHETGYESFLNGFVDNYIEALMKLPDGAKYAEKAEKWRGVLFATMCESIKLDNSTFNVLNHGDMWSNNLMFRYDKNGSVVDIKLVDYQLSHWGSAAYDIYYYMMSSWSMEIKIKKFNELIRFYFDELIENLKLLKYQKKLPTFGELQAELLKRKFFASGLTVEILPFPLWEKCLMTEEFMLNFYENPLIEKAFAEVIPWLYEQEALNFPCNLPKTE